ncbi:hypothetical protein BJ138DRAFT_1131510 [Hygrophoropsis aurantiaca]|uniref:Uncharacterized protein n=1 Tax=Hygrophoropsis aurantiaca TaxID=72124 RepID=A0ACB7ZRV6_9AGAM|nr:hypothetical protein BJ138DRAFT_1131510 [Hygrophoropsis aurantiaca]
MRLLSVSGLLLLLSPVFADSSSSGGLAPPGLHPLIARGDALLSAGQYSDAAKSYSDAISLSPADYLLFYKRATAYFSLSRHPSALDDFTKVLELTGGEFDRAVLMMAKIHMKDGEWSRAKEALSTYAKKSPTDTATTEMLQDIADAEAAAKKAASARRAQLWTACTEAATQALRVASHSLQVRQTRAECSLAGGDMESAVVDLSRLSHLSHPTTSSLMRIFRLSYFLLSPSQSSSSHTSHLSPLKQCLHLDPDSSSCLPAHRLAKSLDKGFTKLAKLADAGDWRGVIKHAVGSAKEFPGDGFAKTFDDALTANASPQLLASPSSSSSKVPIPLPDAHTSSPRRAHLLRTVCRAYTKLGTPRKGEVWCDALLGMSEEALHSIGDLLKDGNAEEDGWIGKGEALLAREEWDEAVRAFERAFEASGRENRETLGRLQKAQRLLKQSKQKDYYKVLGVARDADGKTIKKAYRKAVLTAHPDKGGSEAKMAAVNEAYEVLSNPELRQRFDNGDDPNDPMSGGPGGGHGGPFPFGGGGGDHPFAHFFQQAGHGGFSFHHH